MASQTPFTEDDRTLLRCIEADYDYISEQFLQMKAQLQRMENRMQEQERELADLRREQDYQRGILEFMKWERKKRGEERPVSPTLEAPDRVQ